MLAEGGAAEGSLPAIPRPRLRPEAIAADVSMGTSSWTAVATSERTGAAARSMASLPAACEWTTCQTNARVRVSQGRTQQGDCRRLRQARCGPALTQKMLLGVLNVSLKQGALVQGGGWGDCRGCGEVRAWRRSVEGRRPSDGLGRCCPGRQPPAPDCRDGRGGPGLERRVRVRAGLLGNWRGRCGETEQEVGRG